MFFFKFSSRSGDNIDSLSNFTLFVNKAVGASQDQVMVPKGALLTAIVLCLEIVELSVAGNKSKFANCFVARRFNAMFSDCRKRSCMIRAL